MARKRYRDAEWVEKQYVEMGKSQTDIAEMCGCSPPTITRWMQNHGIEVRDRSEATKMGQGREGGRYEDAEWLKQKYVEEGLSTVEVADVCDCHPSTVSDYLHKYDIDVLSPSEATKRSDNMGSGGGREHPRWVEYCTHRWHDGYECWHTDVGEKKHQVMVHRLIAVAEYGVESIKNKHIHHKNGVPWDNRPDNLEPLSIEEHMRRHIYDKEDMINYSE